MAARNSQILRTITLILIVVRMMPESLGMLGALSPINHIRPGLPPFLLLHGDADQSVPYEQSLAFQAKLRTHGVLNLSEIY